MRDSRTCKTRQWLGSQPASMEMILTPLPLQTEPLAMKNEEEVEEDELEGMDINYTPPLLPHRRLTSEPFSTWSFHNSLDEAPDHSSPTFSSRALRSITSRKTTATHYAERWARSQTRNRITRFGSLSMASASSRPTSAGSSWSFPKSPRNRATELSHAAPVDEP